MRNPTPHKLAIIVSFAVAFVSILLTFLFTGLVSNYLFMYITLFFSVLLLSYFLFYYVLEVFIYSKIKLIYKTIYNLRLSKERVQPQIDLKTDVLTEVNQEVLDWMQMNTNEIEQLKKLESFRREFLGNVSHELKTPIFSIQGYIHTLIDGGLEDEHINMLYLEKAARNVERLCTIVDDLEAISKFESGELILEVRSFDIYELTRDVFDSLEMKARERNISFGFKDGSDRSFYVEADQERIRQVLVNLIVNSIKYGSQGGRTEIGYYDMDKHVLVEVSDNGIGVKEEHLPRLFERFYRVDKSRSRQQGGTGLGLSIVKHIIEAHTQTINVRSSIGIGTTFWFTLKKG